MKIYRKVTQIVCMALCVVPLSGIVSCKKDILNPKSQTLIEEEYVFDTPSRVLGMVLGLYDGVKAGQYRGGRYLIYNDIRAEEFLNRTQNGVTGLQTWSHNLSSSTNEVENLWGAAYQAINRINVFLTKLEANASKVDPALFKQYKAEGKFLRALCYFDLVVIYARPYTSNNGASPGLPMRLQAETTAENNNLARSSVSDVYGQILKDLNEAEPDLPSTYGTDIQKVTRAHKNAAIALKTRVYLSMGNYNEVVSEAKKIVSTAFQAPSGVPHKLQDNVVTPFTNYITTESVFSMPMTDSDPPGTQNQIGFYFNKPGAGNGEYSLNPQGIIKDTTIWRNTDARRVNFVETVVVDKVTSYYLTKYKKPTPFTDYVPVIRYAETLLNYAEAAARTGDLSKGVELLSAVRKRSDPTYIFPSAAVATQDELIKTILTERRIELLGEGFRSIDLLRTGQAIPAKSNVNAVQPSEKAYIWPIPNTELLTNKLMTPN